jgi:hypothetical protein
MSTGNNQYRYGSRVTIHVTQVENFRDLVGTTLSLNSRIIMIYDAPSGSWESGRKFQFSLEAFPTATIAEQEGSRLAQSLLLSAVSLNFGMRLEYHSQEPVIVYDRFAPMGDTVSAEGVTHWDQSTVWNEIEKGVSINFCDQTMLMSLELYCAALLETSARARFIMVVSALEPIATQQDHGKEVSDFVDGAVIALEQATGIADNVKRSLEGGIEKLGKESIGFSLSRLSEERFPNRPDVKKRITKAYALRSQLLHRGSLQDPDFDLASETNEIARVLRSIYALKFNREFRVPPTA